MTSVTDKKTRNIVNSSARQIERNLTENVCAFVNVCQRQAQFVLWVVTDLSYNFQLYNYLLIMNNLSHFHTFEFQNPEVSRNCSE